MRIMRTAIALLAWCSLESAAHAQVVTQWTSGSGGNDHYYKLVIAPSGITWVAASAAATSAGGYLATVTSAPENSFVYGLASAFASAWFLHSSGNGLGPWLGGYQSTFTSEPAGGWVWVTGETWSYTNWAATEPSNGGAGEDRLQYFGSNTLLGSAWNDAASGGDASGPAHGYMIEFNTAPVPEPSTYAAFFGIAALLVAAGRRSLRGS